MQQLHRLAIASIVGISSLLGVSSWVSSAPRPPLFAVLLGENEVVVPDSSRPRLTLANQGDLNGSGSATIKITKINDTQARLCYGLVVSGIGPTVAAAHIHEGEASENGPIVVDLITTAKNGSAFSGCTNVDLVLAAKIQFDPLNYYFNVHTPEFPAGAVRGQLK